VETIYFEKNFTVSHSDQQIMLSKYSEPIGLNSNDSATIHSTSGTNTMTTSFENKIV
jgi:hypothetical protein